MAFITPILTRLHDPAALVEQVIDVSANQLFGGGHKESVSPATR